MKDFELFMCCMGNGTTLCNKANEKHGGYETIGHISEHGVIRFYVPEDSIPPDAMKRIRKCAERDREKFMESWNRKSYLDKYQYIMEIPTVGCGLTKFDLIDMENKNLPLEERVKLIEEEFFKTHM